MATTLVRLRHSNLYNKSLEQSILHYKADISHLSHLALTLRHPAKRFQLRAKDRNIAFCDVDRPRNYTMTSFIVLYEV